jgi:hypothetical protein
MKLQNKKKTKKKRFVDWKIFFKLLSCFGLLYSFLLPFFLAAERKDRENSRGRIQVTCNSFVLCKIRFNRVLSRDGLARNTILRHGMKVKCF